MTQKTLHLRLGLFVCLSAAFLALYAIPNFVFAPSNVGNVVLSPLFWPYILSGLAGLVGLGLIASSFGSNASEVYEDEEVTAVATEGLRPWLRLAASALIMFATVIILPFAGMVLTTMIAFISCSLLFGTRYRLAALICAFVVPLLLYAFFAHVAGVAIPQGEFVRLP